MGIGLVGQAKVAIVFRFVHGLLHRAQQHHLQQLFVWAACKLFCQGCVVFWRRVVAAAQSHAQQSQLRAQGFQFFRRRAFVIAVERWVFVFQQKFCGAHVRGQHAFFNQTVGFVAHHRFNAVDFAVVIENHLRFDAVKFHRAALLAFGQQFLIQFVQGVDLRFQIVLLTRFYPLPHLGVSQAGMRAHHRRIKFVRFHIAHIGDNHVTHHAQALHIGIERADAIGQILRQHRNHTAWEIHTGTAFARINVDAVAIFHIMADIGNRHHQAVVTAHFFGKHGIVKVARGFAINGDQWQLAQIHTAFAFSRFHIGRYFACCFQACR